MQKFVCAIGLFALILIFQELLVPIEGSRVRVVKVKKTRHDKRQAQPTGYDFPGRYDDDESVPYANRRSRVDLEDIDDFSDLPANNNRNVKRQSDKLKDDNDGQCRGDDCGDGIPGDAGSDYPTFASPPKTSFQCKDQKFPGYYADPESKCQSFWICQAKRSDVFLCPNGTIFNQQVLVCDWWFNVDCNTAKDFYSRNQYIYAGPGYAINGDPIPVYKSDKDKNTAAGSTRESRATVQSKLQSEREREREPVRRVGPTGGSSNYNRRAAPRDNYETDVDESINYALATRQQQYQPKTYTKREPERDLDDPRQQQRYLQAQVQAQPIRQTTVRRNEDYTTLPSVEGGYSTGSSGGTGSTGGYQTDATSYRNNDPHKSGVTAQVPYSKLSKNQHPFLAQGTYPSQTSRQTTPTSVTPRRDYSSQRALPIQNPNSIPYQSNNKQQDIYKKTNYGSKSSSSNNPQQYYQPTTQQQQRYFPDSDTQRPPTTTKRNAIDEDFDKEYLDSDDGFNFHFAKIPVQKPEEPETTERPTSRYAEEHVSVTTYRPSIVTTSKIFTSPEEVVISPRQQQHNIKHPKYDEDEDLTYTTPAPVFGKKVKSGKKRNTADWTSYFRSKN